MIRPTYTQEPPCQTPEFGPTRSWWLGLDRDGFAAQQRLESPRLQSLGTKAEPRGDLTSDSFGRPVGHKTRTAI